MEEAALELIVKALANNSLEAQSQKATRRSARREVPVELDKAPALAGGADDGGSRLVSIAALNSRVD